MAPEPWDLRGDFSGSTSQLGHFSRPAAASPHSAAARGGTMTWRPTTVPTSGFPNSDGRGGLAPSGHLGTHFEVPTLLGWVVLGPTARGSSRSMSRRVLRCFIGGVICSANARSKEEVTEGHGWWPMPAGLGEQQESLALSRPGTPKRQYGVRRN